MSVSFDGKTVRFKTEPDALFNSEKSGAKPNTVRIIDAYERDLIQEKLPEKIIIQHQQEIFMRTITHVYVSEQILGKYLAVFSWTNESHHHPVQKPTDHDPGAHTMSLDQEPPIDMSQSTILLPRTQIHELIHLAGDRPLPELIASMLTAYTVPPHCHPPAWTLGDGYNKPEQEPIDPNAHNVNTKLAAQLSTADEIDKKFPTIRISKQLFHLIEAIRHGRTINETIQELYEEHSFRKGPLHD